MREMLNLNTGLKVVEVTLTRLLRKMLSTRKIDASWHFRDSWITLLNFSVLLPAFCCFWFLCLFVTVKLYYFLFNENSFIEGEVWVSASVRFNYFDITIKWDRINIWLDIPSNKCSFLISGDKITREQNFKAGSSGIFTSSWCRHWYNLYGFQMFNGIGISFKMRWYNFSTSLSSAVEPMHLYAMPFKFCKN